MVVNLKKLLYYIIIVILKRGCGGMVDATDLKSVNL